jgi:hypothetical protein
MKALVQVTRFVALAWVIARSVERGVDRYVDRMLSGTGKP